MAEPKRNIKTISQMALCQVIVLIPCVAFLNSAHGKQRQTAARSKDKSACQAQPLNVDLQGRKLAVHTSSGAVFFSAGMQIDADGAPNAYGPNNTGLDYTANAKNGDRWVGVATDSSGRPVVQRSGHYRGLYVSQTTLRKEGASVTSPRTYVNASKIPFIALPPEFTQQFGVSLGDFAVVVNSANGKRAYAIYADVGPNGKIGEGSIALARTLGIDAKPRRGGVSSGISYLVFPKSGLGQGRLRTVGEINASASRLFKQWGGDQRLRVCDTAPRYTIAQRH
jgi:hypothetical protein